MLILDNKFTRRFRIHVHVISLITISVNAAPQNKDVIMELKQLSVNRGNPISDSMKEHGPKMMSQMKTTFNPNIFLTGSSSMRPNAARANNSKANMTNAQLLLRDTYNAPIAFPKNSLPAIRASDNINFKSASSRNDRTRQAYCSSIIGGTFCNTSGDDYPKKLVENILRDSTFRPLFNKYFGNDTITSDVENLSTRIEFDNSEPTEYDNFKPICASEEFIYRCADLCVHDSFMIGLCMIFGQVDIILFNFVGFVCLCECVNV